MRKGWFRIAGVQDGDRSLKDQLKGLAPALAEASGKSVLDLGSAEGLISLEFARAGARRVVGLEVVVEHVELARKLCAGSVCEFHAVDLDKVAVDLDVGYDVVLMLAIIHKLKEPARVLSMFASIARELVVFRMPAFWEGKPPTTFRSERYAQQSVDVAKVLRARSFVLERIERGPTSERGQEPVLYFRRVHTGAA
jgi:SAM-dependent methyltransferase